LGPPAFLNPTDRATTTRSEGNASPVTPPHPLRIVRRRGANETSPLTADERTADAGRIGCRR
jgi:hypothetical protein